MKRQFTVMAAILVLFAMACGSMNRVTPKQWDDKTIEADVRSKFVTAVPEKTFAIEVKVHQQVVTLSGYAKTEEDRRKLVDAAQSVNGVKTVINNITIKP